MPCGKKEASPANRYGAFNQTIADAFISIDNIDACWQRYQPGLWVISDRQGYRFATVKFPEVASLKKNCFSLNL